MGTRGDADVLLVHAPDREKEMVVDGFAVNRRIVMHNDFLIVGPEEDPAGVHGRTNGAESVLTIAEAGARFASRGDNSGTHMREMSLWSAAGIEPAGDWYISTGQGMGATLQIAAERQAYVLTDRGTHLALQEHTSLVPHVEGDPLFLNIYSVLEVNPERFERLNNAGAVAFSEFLLGREAQEIIRVFGTEQFGQPLAEFQGLAFKLARMELALENARNLVFKLAWAQRVGKLDPRLASLAKLYCAEQAVQVSLDAIQIHGGSGYMAELPLEKLMRDAKMFEIGGGTNEIQLQTIARSILV